MLFTDNYFVYFINSKSYSLHSHSKLDDIWLNVFEIKTWEYNVFFNNFINMLFLNLAGIFSLRLFLLCNPKISRAHVWRIGLATVFWSWFWSCRWSSLSFYLCWLVKLLNQIFVLICFLLSLKLCLKISFDRFLFLLLYLLLIVLLLLNNFFLLIKIRLEMFCWFDWLFRCFRSWIWRLRSWLWLLFRNQVINFHFDLRISLRSQKLNFLF